MNVCFKRFIVCFCICCSALMFARPQRANANPVIILGVEVTAEAVVYLGCATLSSYQVYNGVNNNIDIASFKSACEALKDDKENFSLISTLNCIVWSVKGWSAIKKIIESYAPVSGTVKIKDNFYSVSATASKSGLRDNSDYIPLSAGTYTFNYSSPQGVSGVTTRNIYPGGGLCLRRFEANGLAQCYLNTYSINTDGLISTGSYAYAVSVTDTCTLFVDFQSDVVVESPTGVWDNVKAQSLPVDTSAMDASDGYVACPVVNTGTLDAPVYAPTGAYDWTNARVNVGTATDAGTVVDAGTAVDAGTITDAINDADIGDLSVPSSATLNFAPLQIAGTTFTTKFPFCIPWDLANSVKSLSVAPVPPKWTIVFPSNYFVGGGSIDIDFVQFESWAIVIRWGIFIIFCGGLIVITRKMIGSE